MLDPCVVVADNILVLQARLDVYLAFDDFIVLLSAAGQFDEFDTVDVAVDAISHLVDFTLTALA